jgi:AraC-like DNA-binding protein
VKELLSSGGYTVAGAAYACGFGDIAHFYRTFKKHENQTPLQWMSV